MSKNLLSVPIVDRIEAILEAMDAHSEGVNNALKKCKLGYGYPKNPGARELIVHTRALLIYNEAVERGQLDEVSIAAAGIGVASEKEIMIARLFFEAKLDKVTTITPSTIQ